jgi:hypothetical protein
MKSLSWKLGIFLALLAIAGCCCKSSDDKACAKGSAVAKINNYVMTSADFQEEASFAAPTILMSTNPDQAKEKALNELIIRKILLQEAQKKNFDKDQAFRKEIEKYWEQALLKLLMKEKIKEISKKIPPDITGEVRQEMIQSQLSKWVVDMRKSAKVKIYRENLRNTKIE